MNRPDRSNVTLVTDHPGRRSTAPEPATLSDVLEDLTHLIFENLRRPFGADQAYVENVKQIYSDRLRVELTNGQAVDITAEIVR